MTLSGVLKDILLVAASMLIFRDPVSGLQAFGYTIALCGLVYYKLGAENLKTYIGHGQRGWADYGARHPVWRKLIVFAMVFVGMLLLLGVVSSTGAIPEHLDPAKLATHKVHDLLGRFGA